MAFGATAVGPFVGGELIKATGTTLSIYYFGFGVNVLLLLLWVFVVPESLDDSIRQANRDKYLETARRREQSRPKPTTGLLLQIAWYFHPAPLLELAAPLSICLPQLKDPLDPSKGRDWNLAYTSLGYLCLVMVQVKPPRASFPRDSPLKRYRAGRYLSFSSCSSSSAGTQCRYDFRALSLPILHAIPDRLLGWDAGPCACRIPVVHSSRYGTIRPTRKSFSNVLHGGIFTLARPKPRAISLPGPEEQLHAAESSSSPASPTRQDTPPSLDLAVVQVSLVGDGLTLFAMVLAANVQQFVVFSMGLALGAGLAPAFMSLALALSPGGAAEGGKLFGAFGIITSFGCARASLRRS